MAYELNCKACGQHFRDDDKEKLARDVEEHNRKMHGEERLDRQAFEGARAPNGLIRWPS